MTPIRQLTHASVPDDGSFAAHSDAGDMLEMGFAARRLGDYLELAFISGAVEMTLRLRGADLARALRKMDDTISPGAARTVGTAQSELLLTRQDDHTLLLRPRLTSDATGSIALHFALVGSALVAFTHWVGDISVS